MKVTGALGSALAALLLLSTLMPASARAQNRGAQRDTTSLLGLGGIRLVDFSSGLGLTTARGHLSFELEASASTRRYVFSGRFLHTTEVATSPRALSEVGLLAGWHLRSSDGLAFLEVQAGASVVFDVRRGDARDTRDSSNGLCVFFCSPTEYERYSVPAFGIPAEVQMTFTPHRNFGFGLRLVGNANTVRSFAGAFFTLHVGQLR